MTRTEYLFGQHPSKYASLQIPLAEMKIRDATKLIDEVGKELDLLDPSQDQKNIRLRFDAAKKAKEFWQEILDEMTE